jgi:hypothetical protein
VAPRPTHRLRSRLASSSSSSSTISDGDGIVVMNWECVADTLSYRIPLGIDVALQVWPELNDIFIDVTKDDVTWLHNKLAALAHVFSSSSSSSEGHSSVTVDYCLATRLLLEEQELDQGESNGKGGKYASRFHPRTTQTSSSSKPPPKRSTRPLTVGEIAENWSIIRETLEIKYHCDFQNPLHILETTIGELQELCDPPSLLVDDTNAVSLLCNPSQRIILTVPCSSEFSVAQSSFRRHANVDFVATESIQDAMDSKKPVVVLQSNQTMMDLLKAAPEESTIVLVDSSWERLQDQIPLFGDYIPRVDGSRKTKCAVPNRYLSLNLAEWSSHPTQVPSAVMNPWTNVLAWNKLEAMVAPAAFQ